MSISKKINLVKLKIAPLCDRVKRFDHVEAFLLFASLFASMVSPFLDLSIADAGSPFGAKPARLWINRGLVRSGDFYFLTYPCR
jgi:hypothetical protein